MEKSTAQRSAVAAVIVRQFPHHLLGDAELAEEELMCGGVVERERQDGQAAALARDATQAGRDRCAGVVVPDIEREPAGEPAPGEVLATESLGAKGRKSTRDRRQRRLVPSRQPRDDAFQQQVDRARRLVFGRECRRLGSLDDSVLSAEPLRTAAQSASRCVSRASSGSSGSRRFAAALSRAGVSLPGVRANAI